MDQGYLPESRNPTTNIEHVMEHRAGSMLRYDVQTAWAIHNLCHGHRHRADDHLLHVERLHHRRRWPTCSGSGASGLGHAHARPNLWRDAPHVDAVVTITSEESLSPMAGL